MSVRSSCGPAVQFTLCVATVHRAGGMVRWDGEVRRSCAQGYTVKGTK